MPAMVDIASLPVALCVGARAAATELCGAEASTGPAVAALAAGVSSPASASEPSAGASGTDEDDVDAGDTVGDEGAGAWGAFASLSAEPVGGMSFMNQAYPIASRLACPQTPRDVRAPRQDQTGTLHAVDDLISRLSSSPDAALFRAMVKGRLSPCSKVCEECHASRSLFSNRTVARHRRGFRSKTRCRIRPPRKELAATTRTASAKMSSRTNSRWHPACRSTAIASVTPAARPCKATLGKA
jgi:hypothetical protein